MHLFCDESGGADRDVFLVCAVHIASGSAHRILKKFRKISKIPGEVKGHTLATDQRKKFFEILAEYSAHSCVSITCSRSHYVGGWAMNCLEDSDLWLNLYLQSCYALMDKAPRAIVIDGGRYKRDILYNLKTKISDVFGNSDVDYRDSFAVDGLQIADVIANTVYRAQNLDQDCAQLVCSHRQIIIRHVDLSHACPDWLIKQAAYK